MEIYSLDRQLTEEYFGGKVMGLQTLQRKVGVAIPWTIAVSMMGFREALAGCGSAPLKLFIGLKEENVDQVSEEMTKIIMGMKIPVTFAQDVVRYLSDIDCSWVAVRSSGIGEDGEFSSFAGQHDSVIGVNAHTPSDIATAVKKVWVSAFSPRALSYRLSNGMTDRLPDMAVVIQAMVNPVIAGTAFSIEPSGNNPSLMAVEVVQGFGEALVSGEVTPSLYLVDRNSGEIVAKNEVEQDRYLAMGEDGKIAWKMEETTDKVVLTETMVKNLYRGILLIESQYTGGVDVEFAFEQDRQAPIYLQARPLILAGGMKAGKGASHGTVIAKGTYMEVPKQTFVEKGILLTRKTDPRYLPVMKKAGGIVTEVGGITCHAAIVSRELGIPCVVGAGSWIRGLNGKKVEVNGQEGTVKEVKV